MATPAAPSTRSCPPRGFIQSRPPGSPRQPIASQAAFTLIELLVVVTIIVVLLALLAPALDKAVEAAQRAVCAANLDSWGGAHGMYFMDNQRKLMMPPLLFQARSPYPVHAWVWNEAGHEGEWSAQAYAPYNNALSFSVPPTRGQHVQTPVGGAKTHGAGTGATVSKVFLCPSDPRYDSRIVRNNNEAQKPPGPTKGTGDLAADPGGPIVESHYSYFGMVSRYQRGPGGEIRAPWPQELTDRNLGGNRLLMNDHLYYWQGGGWGQHSYSHGEPPQGGNPKIAGVNQLYGDGAVVWIDQQSIPNQAMSGNNAMDTGPAARDDIPRYVNSQGAYANPWASYHFYIRP